MFASNLANDARCEGLVNSQEIFCFNSNYDGNNNLYIIYFDVVSLFRTN